MVRATKRWTCLAALGLAVSLATTAFSAARQRADGASSAAAAPGCRSVAGLLIPAKARLIIGYSRVALA